ncbi:RrF2 family transcriptional regulator [Parasporobacterium paucivorans]|uniref:Transcriptional regulator, BadM/Rrf2 family n=1 Tax=Parasporobacterium paucivorans DSM 15970 TaxID=1122934 RepID=A0A1M6KK76_9FIRM|nr:Rrf2 family transcriptional regulator [Parasporobacterium paucivorans]SHJ59388.1 transcriptional regulator, BadM/Rrf2 family [Parasporobacterium paucivorans DSM 15970]
MKLSTKSRYGLRAMVDLAVHADEGPVSLRSVAERQHLSEGYLEQIIAKMKKAGFVTSSRGAIGGYTISRPLKDISAGDIIRTLEGNLKLVDCPGLNEEGPEDETCSGSELCVTKYVWEKANAAIDSAFDSITLEELAEESKKALENKQSKETE